MTERYQDRATQDRATEQRASIVIGTRGSPLALAQARETRSRLLAAIPGLTDNDVAIQTYKTTGDRIQDRSLADSGGKGLFTKEIEDALLAGEIDLAVHSMKDMPTQLPAGLIMAAYLPREDPRDVLLGAQPFSTQPWSLQDLPQGAVVGTSSLRRKAFLLARRPDLQVIEFRGNVETRLRKLQEGVAAATFLARAGLNRLGLEPPGLRILAPEEMLPAVAQGAIGIECRAEDQRIQRYLTALDDAPTRRRVEAERSLLAVLDGSCRTPIAALAEINAAGSLRLRAAIAKPDGSVLLETERFGEDGVAMGADAGAELRARGGADFF